MSRLSLDPLAMACAILAGAGLGLAGVLLAGWHGSMRYVGIPVVELPLPGTMPVTGPSASASPPADWPVALPPREPDPALLERRGKAALPVIASDGRTSLQAYARPAPPGSGPAIAILVTGLGLAKDLTERGLALPSVVSLAFSPYAQDLPGWMRQARLGGHEALLEAPLQAADPGRDDRGPLALRPDQAEPALQAALLDLLARGEAYIGLVSDGGAFTAQAFAPLAGAVAARGLGFVQLGGAALGPAAAERGLAYLGSGAALDEAPTQADLDRALGALEAQALSTGEALGWTRSYPALLDRLGAWAAGLPGKGLRLVPVSALLGESDRADAEARP